MYELLQHLIAFKYTCKINHWTTHQYSQHLLYDRLTADLDTWIDEIAEIYFAIFNDKKIFKPDILSPKYVGTNLASDCEQIIRHLEKLQNDTTLNQGTKSLLSGIEKGFLNKLALARLT